MKARAQLTHCILESLNHRNGELLIGEHTVSELRDRVGRTPFYVYDRQAITMRLMDLRRLLPPGIDIHYAIKANPFPELVRHLASLVDGFDVASGGELHVALDTGMAPGRISIAGPGKSSEELRAAVSSGVKVNVESERELFELQRVGGALGVRPRVALRINPTFELKAAGMKMGGGPSQFGIDAELVPKMLRGINPQQLDFIGFHIFAGSQNLNATAIVECQNRTLDLAESLAGDAPAPLRELNIGGGFGIPYFAGEESLDLTPIAANLAQLCRRARQNLPEARLALELGRYLVGECGYYICQIVDRKISRGRVYLVTDGGLHHHLAASGNFGQVIRKNFPVVIGNRIDSPESERVWVTGPLCTPLDLLAENATLARASPGDLVVILQSGAYGRTASPLGFLGHPPPVELLA